MLSKEKFIEYLTTIIKYNEEVDKWIDFFKTDIFESPLFQRSFDLIDIVIKYLSDNNADIEDLISWWLYEDVDKLIFLPDDTTIDVKTPDKLYDYIMNDMNTINIKVINKSNNPLPKYETEDAAGLDIRVDLSRVTPDNPIKGFGDAEVIWSGEGHSVPMVRIAPMSRALLPTGIFTAIPKGWQVSFRPRSGMAIKKGLTLINTPSTIDSDYRGEWGILVINLGLEDIYIEDGERICQAILEPVHHVNWQEVNKLDETERGTGGYGHTGEK